MSHRRLIGTVAALIVCVLALVRSGEAERLLGQLGLRSGESSKATVVRAVDGDTLEVRVDGKTDTVRLIGIDTPETVRPGVSVECGGPDASKLMHHLAAGRTVRLETDPTQDERDRYGRLLAYVYPEGSDKTLQERMLAAGRAEVYVYGGKEFKLVDRFRRAAEAAEQAGKGTWGPPCNGDFHSQSS